VKHGNGTQTANQTKNESLHVAKATSVVAAVTLLSRIFGVIRDSITGALFGAGMATDAFFVAFRIPNLLRRLVAEGSLSAAFVPVFTDEIHNSEEQAKKAVAAATSFSLILTVVISLLGVYFAEELTVFFAPGFGVDSEKSALSASLLQIMFPFTILVSQLALASSVLNALGRFAAPAFAPVLLNVGIIAFALCSGMFKEPVEALAWGVLAGGVAQLIPQVVLLKRLGYPMSLGNPFNNPAVGRLVRLMLPSVVSASGYQMMVFLNTLLASMLIEGSVSWLYYADRLFQFPLGVFSIAVATAVLPTLSRCAARNDNAELQRQLGNALEWVTFITVPATVGLIVLREHLVASLFEYGRFDYVSTQQTALSLLAFSVGLWPISCQSILARAFLAKKNAKIPAYISTATVFLNMYFALAFMGVASAADGTPLSNLIVILQQHLNLAGLGHTGLALAGSFASFVSMFALIMFLPRVGLSTEFSGFSNCLTKTLLASLAMGGTLAWLNGMTMSRYSHVIVGLLAGLAVFFVFAFLLRIRQLKQLTSMINHFLKRKTA